MGVKQVDRDIKEIEGKISEIKNNFGNTVLDFEAYMEERKSLNIMIIQTIFGASIKKSKNDDLKIIVRFKYRMPDCGQLARMISVLENFVEWEKGLLDEIEEKNDKFSEMGMMNGVPMIENPTVNLLSSWIFDTIEEDIPPLMNFLLTPLDLSTVAAMAQQARHNRNFKIGVTVTIGVGVAIVGGVLIWKYLLSDNNDENTDDSNIDVNDIDVDAIDVDDLDDIDVNDIDVDNLGDLTDVDVE